MNRVTTLAVVGGFLVGLALGCGSSKPPEAAGGGEPPTKPGDPPTPISHDELPAQKAQLAEMEKQAAAKERELADLKARIVALRQRIDAAEAGGVKVYRSPAELFAGMPKDIYPKSTDTGIERTATRKWIDDNLLGGSYEWEAKLTGFNAKGEAEPLDVWFAKDERVKTYYRAGDDQQTSLDRHSAIALGQIKLGDQECEVFLNNATSRNLGAGLGQHELTEYTRCSLAEAKALRAYNDTKATLRGRITEVEIHNTGWVARRESAADGASKRVAFFVKLHAAAVNGYLPENSRPPDKK